MRSIKVNDSNQTISIGSRAHDYWVLNSNPELVKELRPGITPPRGLSYNNVDSIVKQFKLKGIAFGNWVTIEDRINYLQALFIAFYDLNKVLRFSSNVGIGGNLAVTFGDRGIPHSLAHYRPGENLININRYERGEDSKLLRFLSTGGIHSFAHEYGHFLDYFAGSVFDPHPSYFPLSNGRSLARYRTGINSPIRKKMDDILEKTIWKKPGVKLSRYYISLIDKISKTENLGDYWIRRNELFARAFEVYVMYELKAMGIKNEFLTKTRYVSWAYVPESQLMDMIPDFRELLTLIRKKI